MILKESIKSEIQGTIWDEAVNSAQNVTRLIQNCYDILKIGCNRLSFGRGGRGGEIKIAKFLKIL